MLKKRIINYNALNKPIAHREGEGERKREREREGERERERERERVTGVH